MTRGTQEFLVLVTINKCMSGVGGMEFGKFIKNKPKA